MSLYIRPTMIGTQAGLGVGASTEILLFVIMSPVGPYYKTGFKPVSLLATTEHVRAWPGGTGAFKLGSNYAGGVVPQMEAAKKGFQQILWLFGPDHQLTVCSFLLSFPPLLSISLSIVTDALSIIQEAGTMNLWAVLSHPDGSTSPPSSPSSLTNAPRQQRSSSRLPSKTWS